MLDLAAADEPWTSVRAEKEDVPTRWGEFEDVDTIRLKDTRNAYWSNRLVSPNEFVYMFPTIPKQRDPSDFVKRLRERVRTLKPLRVKLYATPGSRDEYYGEWVVRAMREMGYDASLGCHVSLLTLRRLRRPLEAPSDKALHRSINEGVHEEMLKQLFPEWIVVHEPETLLDLHEPSVVDGIARDEIKVSRSYTCDFVLCQKNGCGRICVESKPCESKVTEEALIKARALRDRSLTRVVFMVGSRDEPPRWLDMGPPFEMKETWYTSIEGIFATT